jgi:hypothetical protein
MYVCVFTYTQRRSIYNYCIHNKLQNKIGIHGDRERERERVSEGG